MEMSRRPAPVVVRASIIVLFALIVRGCVAQQCAGNAWSNNLLLVQEGKISKVDLNGGYRKTVVENPVGITEALDYSHSRKTLYYSDYEGVIWALKDGETKPRPAVPRQTQGRWLPCQLRLDDQGNKMYVADCFSGSVNVFDMDNGDRAVVLGKNLSEIRALEIDSGEGYLFVVDKYRILRTDLDGNNLVVLHEEFTNPDQIYADIWKTLPDDIKEYLRNPEQSKTPKGSEEILQKFLTIPDIALDTESKRIYLVETTKRRIESFDYNGKGRKINFQDANKGDLNSESISSLSYNDGWLYWLDKVNQKLYKINVKNEQSQIILKNEDSQKVFAVGCSEERQTINPCAKENGQCQHFCILSKSSIKKYSCACNVGYELDQDGKSCRNVQEFILYTQSGYLRANRMNVTAQAFSDVINPSAYEVGKGTDLQFNAADEIVYYSSLYPNNKLHQLSLKSGEVKILQPDLLSSKVGVDMAFDWESRNLYYFTYYYKDATTLSVMNVDDPTYSKILVDDVPRLVRALAVHPYKGYVYYALMSDNQWTTISRMSTDGSGLKVLVSKKGAINDLVIDFEEDRLYWCEPDKLYHANLDGEDIHEIDVPNPPVEDLRYFTFYKDYIYAIFKQDQILARLDKNNLKSSSVISYLEETGSISGIEVFAPSSQKKRPGHPCSHHECQRFCFPVPTATGITASCDCPYGEKLSQDGKSCEDNRRQEPPFIPCHSSYLCEKQTEKIDS